MNPLLTLGIFLLGAGTGALLTFIACSGLQAKARREATAHFVRVGE